MPFAVKQIACAVGISLSLVLTSFISPQTAAHRKGGDGNVNTLLIKAEDHYHKREFLQTIQYCLKALTHLPVSAKPEDEIRLRNLLGSSYGLTGSYDEAFSILHDALARGEKKLPSGHPLIGDSHYHLGVYYDHTGSEALAQQHHGEALKIRLENFGAMHPKVAESFNGLGEVYLYSVLDFKKATLNFTNAAAILGKIPEQDEYLRYAVYFNLASASRHLGDTDTALTYAFKALSIIGTKEEFRLKLAKCYSLLGNIYYSGADFDRAIEYMTKGIAESIHHEGPENRQLSLQYLNLGAAHLEKGDIETSIRCFYRSLSINSNVDPAVTSDNFIRLGLAYQRSARFDSAASYMKKCYNMELAHNGEKHFRTSHALLYLARLFHEFKDLDSAAVYIQRSIIASVQSFSEDNIYVNPTLEESGNQRELFEIFASKGAIMKDRHAANQNDPRALHTALASFRISDELMDLNRSAYQGEDSKLFFASHYRNIYEQAIEVAHLLFQETEDEQYLGDALTFMEKNKAFLLAESLQKAEIFNAAGVPDSIREVERNINGELAHYRSQLEEHRLKNGSEEELQGLQGNIFQLSRKKENIMNEIAQRYPNYFFVRYQSLTTLPQVREYAAKNNAMVVEYFWGTERIYVISINGSHANLTVINKPPDLDAIISAYYDELQPGRAGGLEAQRFHAYFTNAHAIYQILLAPAIAATACSNLIVVRDGPLLLIPFESLPVSPRNSQERNYQSLDYLLTHYSVSYAHSASLLVKNARRRNQSATNRILALSYSTESGSRNTSAAHSLNELPGSAKELNAISRSFSGSFLQGPGATEKNFKTLAPDYDILHLAVHGKADPAKQLGGILLFNDSTDSDEDGELHLYELYNLSLGAKLAVLSACESGVGKLYHGEGVFSISRGFDYAGCPSTVLSLWKVSDAATASIMEDFYGALAEGTPIDESLRWAKLRYLERTHPRLAHPTYWAAFIPTGNMKPITEEANPYLVVSALSLLFFVLVGLFWWKATNRSRTAVSL